MEATVVGAVIGATIQVVLQQLLSLPRDRIKDFKKDLKKIKSSFDMLNDVLYHADLQHVTDRPLKRWMRELEDLAFEADNVLDEINYQLMSNLRTKTKNKVRSFFSPSKNPIANRLRLAAQIREINKNLELSNQEATAFGLQARLAAGVRAPDFGSASSSMETDSFAVDPIFIGRQNDVSRIVEMLVTATAAEGVPSVLPIVGMGGLGKTTLARKVFGHQTVLSHFGDNRVWVHVPRHFDGVVLFKNILTSMTTDNVEHGNREALLKKLQNNLGTKRYLLVLDDVWNEERGKWDDFVNSLSGISSAAGNCMIVTTRSAEVGSTVRTLDVHALEGLSTENCWSIIKAKAFQAGDNPLDEFEAVGINIAKTCKGLPLAANVVGGLLRDKLIDEWISFEKNWLSNFGDGNPISKILKSSFDNLPLPSLKKCFAYCSIFPKGYQIEKEILIELWMAEGFLLQPYQEKNNMETIGSKFFTILLQKSLLQVADRDIYGYVTHCNMHDFVHDLACSVLCENNNATDGVFQSRYIGYDSRGQIESLSISKDCLRTLFFNGNVSDIIFSNFKSIRTLILSGKEIGTLPPSVRELIHLRYLDTSEAMIAYFPDTFGELYNLETLRAQGKWGVSYLEKLPDSLKYLISLRHLHLSDNTTLPPEIGRLTSLQTLQHFHVRQEKGYGISELGRLKNLKGKLEIHNLEKVHGKDEAMSADLFGKKDIDELSFKWNATNRELGEANDECVLEGLQPHPNLKSLIINGFKGIRFPLWALKMEVRDERGLNNLIKIELEGCMQVEELPMLGFLPRLKSLKISNLRDVRSIGSSFYGINNRSGDTIVVFPALERLVLSNMPNLREWAEVEFLPSEVVVFPRLEYLELRDCRQLMSAPSHFPCLKELKIFYMDSGVPLENILLCGSNNKLGSLTNLEIGGINGLECLPDGVFSNNHNLLKLKISKCMNLRGLPDGLHTLSSLESLIIEECPNLKSIAAAAAAAYPPKRDSNNIDESQNKKCFFSTSLLRDLTFRDCKGLIHLPIEMVESCAPSLESLELHGLNSLTNIPMVIGCLHKMPRLKWLTITEVPKFSRIEIGSFGSSSLQRLEMGPWSSDDNNVSSSFNEVVDAILQTSRVSLSHLSLSGMSHWDCLPDQIQHLTSLSELWLDDYGMEALPEWFGNLSSLRELDLINCTKLPSKEAMQQRLVGLTKLTHLDIIGCGCPLLVKVRRDVKMMKKLLM